MSERADRRIPIVVLSGFLGSGKSTLLNAMLCGDHGGRTAVIINEFGEISIDHLLVRSVAGNSVVLKNGCVCCVIRTDLRTALRELLDGAATDGSVPFDRILIETTGIADPGPIAQTIGADPMLRGQTRLAGVVCTFDAVHGPHQMEAHDECRRQLAASDHIILTKTDLVASEATRAIIGALTSFTPSTPVTDGKGSAADFDAIVDRLTAVASSGIASTGLSFRCEAVRIAPQANRMHGGITTTAIETETPIDWTAFAVWLSAFVHHYGDRVLRIKAVLSTAEISAPIALHVIRNHIHPAVHLESWHGEPPASRIVFILQDIDGAAVERSLLDFIGHTDMMKADHVATRMINPRPVA